MTTGVSRSVVAVSLTATGAMFANTASAIAATLPPVSVTVSVTVCHASSVWPVWVEVGFVTTVPSPKSQVQVVSCSPAAGTDDELNVQVRPVLGQEKVKLALGGP